jgi:methylglutaconyl-CoA hydratase
LAKLMQTLNELPKPTIARVNGAALGGGTGLVACCDIVLASAQAIFGTTEVRLGLIPAVIGPYVLAAIGPRHARRLMLTGERISAAEAARLGLVHEVVEPDQLDLAVERIVAELLKSGPGAIAAAKRLIRDLAGRPVDAPLIDGTAQRIAALRATPEAREGIGAFLEKRAPAWLG